jgi:hypothetical protein
VLYNSSVAVYDPARNTFDETITFEGLSGDATYHASGIQVDKTGRLSAIINAGAAFDTAGKNISGDSFLVMYDLKGNTQLWKANLTAATNGVYGGYQDVEHDHCGNSYVIGTYTSSIVKVSADGTEVTPWYKSPSSNQTTAGFTGIAAKDDFFLVCDQNEGRLWRFDMDGEEGIPKPVSIEGGNKVGTDLDGLYMPEKYNGTVALVSSSSATIVLRSKDGKWKTAERLGDIANDYEGDEKTGGVPVTSIQIGDSIYSLIEFFGYSKEQVPGTIAGNRTEFPLQDITAAVEKKLYQQVKIG